MTHQTRKRHVGQGGDAIWQACVRPPTLEVATM